MDMQGEKVEGEMEHKDTVSVVWDCTEQPSVDK